MFKSRKGQEGFTLIELLVVVLIIGILAAIAIPAFLGQKKGAQDANAKSMLRNGAIAMESYYSENQSFDAPATAVPGTPLANADMQAIEPNLTWNILGAAPAVGDATTLAKNDNIGVLPTATNVVNDGYTLYATSASGDTFTYVRNFDASTAKCKDVSAAPAWDTACATNEW